MTSIFQKLDLSRTLELGIARRGWFKAQYILSDGQFEYGMLSHYGGMFSREKLVETADGSWIIKPVGFWAKETQLVNALTGEITGVITRNKWDTTNTISLKSGLTATFARYGGIFSNKTGWSNAEMGVFLQIKTSYKMSKAFVISFDPSIVNKPVPAALLSLIGANIVLIKQAQVAATV